jgi:hypothetical protein
MSNMVAKAIFLDAPQRHTESAHRGCRGDGTLLDESSVVR